MTDEAEISTDDEIRSRIAATREARIAAALAMVGRLNHRDLPMSERDHREALIAERARLPDSQRRERLVRVEARHKAKVETDALNRRLDETERLAAERGEEVERLASGAVRVMDRDPLMWLLGKGEITLDQFDAGAKARALFERQASDLGAMDYSDAGRADHNNDHFVRSRLQRAKVTAIISKLEVDIAFRCAAHRNVIATFKAVVGERKTLRSLGGGRGYGARLEALRAALDVTADTLA